MAPISSTKTSTTWSVEYETIRRQKLFQTPPKDRSAYPALQTAIEPHIQSFNAILEEGGLMSEALKEIGTQIFLDGDATLPAKDQPPRNRLHVRIQEVFVDRPELPASNKFAIKTRNITPAECRERHATYRGRLRARLIYKVNDGEWTETLRELGQIPILLKVRRCES